jgi:hypothetical protein
VAINVPAGTFLSVISLDDANGQAQRYAQAQANAQGTCIPPATVVLTNTPGATIYRVIFSGTSSASYIFPSSGSSTATTTLVPGYYTIQILQSGPGTGGGNYTFGYTNSLGGQSQYGTSATFTNVYVSGTLTLSIN